MAEKKANGANLGYENQLWAAAFGKLIDDAMVAIEKENTKLKGVLLKDYSRPSLDKHRLVELIDIISGIGLGDDESRSKDILGRVYEYFLGRFAAAGEVCSSRANALSRNEVAATYQAWRGEKEAGEYQDVPGFCKNVATGEIREHGYVLTPGRYVGAAEVEDDGIPFEEKMVELSATLYKQFAEADRLEESINRNLEVLGYGS